MTYAEAVRAMEKRTPVIYTGPGSMGRGGTIIGAGMKPIRVRGSLTSIGIIAKVRRTTALVSSDKNYPGGSNYSIKYLYKANKDELKAARARNRKWYPNLKFTY